MDALVGIVGLVFIGVIVYVVCVNWLLRRAAPTDRPAVDDFANQHGLRIISVTRSSNFFRYLFLFGGRLYEIAVEDFEGRRGTIELGFDSLLGPGRPIILGQQGIPFIGSAGSSSLKQPDSQTARPAWTWTERLVLFVVGAGIGGLLFCGALHTYLSPPNRPIIAEPELGYTHLFKAKHGDVYGTFFEYLAVTYGLWISWGIGAAASTFIYFLNIRQKSRTYRWQILAAAAISMPLYYAIWRVFSYVAQS